MNYLNDEYIDNFSIYIEKVDANEVLIFILNMFGRLIVILFSFITLSLVHAFAFCFSINHW